MNRKSQLAALMLGAIATALAGSGQTPAPQVPPTASANLPAFEVATIKPCDPNIPQPIGFYSRPGGRVFVGCTTVKMLAYYAFGIQEERIAVGPIWAGSERFNVVAVPPDSSPSRTAAQPSIGATPTTEQRQMLQALLRDRFKLQSHTESREGEVYLLSLRRRELQLKDTKDPLGDSRGNIMENGQAFGEHVSMAFMAELLTRRLGVPVIDQTGLTGKYDFDLAPTDPDNKDITAAVLDVTNRLGLNLKRGKGSVETLVIDHIERPTEN